MDNTSFLAECLTECVSSYVGIDGYNKKEYILKRGYDLLERELKVKDYLVNIVKCVNKCVFNKNVLSENVDKKISFSEAIAIDSAKNEKYPFDKTKELYFAIFDALKEFHDNYVYNKSVDVRESKKSRRPINNKKFMELNESEFARDYFLFTFIATPLINRIQAKSTYAYQEYVLDADVKEYYESYMGANYRKIEVKEEIKGNSIDDKQLLEILLNNGFKYEFNEYRCDYDITEVDCKLKQVEFPACINHSMLYSYSDCFVDIECEKNLPIEEVVFNSEKVGIYSSFICCPNLKKVIIKGELTAIDQHAFSDCDLIKINEDDMMYVKINDNDYYVAKLLVETEKESLMINKDTHIIASYCANYGEEKILDLANVKYIMDYAFADNENLEQVIVSQHLKYIGEAAFMNCSNLEEMEFPRSLERIEASAFMGTGLKKVSIPVYCKIKDNSFPECCIIERYR